MSQELEAIRIRHRSLPDRGGSADIAWLLDEVDRLRRTVTAVERLAERWHKGSIDNCMYESGVIQGSAARRVRQALAEGGAA